MGGRWMKTLSSLFNNNNHRRILTPSIKPHFPFFINRFLTVAAIPYPDPIDFDHTRGFGAPDDDPSVKIPIKAFFLSTRNPLYLGVIFVVFLLVKALWVQLNIAGEFSHGILPGLISLSTKFVPTIMNLMKRLAEEGSNATTNNNPQRNTSQNNSNAVPVGSSVSSSSSSNITSLDNRNKYTSSSSKDE